MSVVEGCKDRLWAAWRTRTVTIAVTGLSRAGKTAFITRVLANLEAAGRHRSAGRWLNGLDIVDTDRLRSAEQARVYRPAHGRMFPYADMLAKLTADAPDWPARTANIYEAALDLHFWPGRRPVRGDAPAARLRLAFMDCPGEWLADLPMLGQGYAEWSNTVLNRLKAAPWSNVSAAFGKTLVETAWSGADDNESGRKAALESGCVKTRMPAIAAHHPSRQSLRAST